MIDYLLQNRKVKHEYTIIETLEVGIILQGYEVKSINEKKCSFVDSWVSVDNNELYLNNFTIEQYKFTNNPIDPKRKRKLLANKSEIKKFNEMIKFNQSYTIIPLSIYKRNGKYKFEIGVCKGKSNYDKREALKQKESF